MTATAAHGSLHLPKIILLHSSRAYLCSASPYIRSSDVFSAIFAGQHCSARHCNSGKIYTASPHNGCRCGFVTSDQKYDAIDGIRSEEHTSELQSRGHLVCRLLLEKKKTS